MTDESPNFKKPRAVVTGASKGIGLAIAVALMKIGYEVIGTTRSLDLLSNAAKSAGVHFLPLELIDESSIKNFLQMVGDVDVLINNAGGSQSGPIEEIPMRYIRRYFDQNFFGLVQLIQGVLPSMREKRHGVIINISSMASNSPVLFSSIYAATKAAINLMSFGLRAEVRPFGIQVVVIAPFEINTSIPQDSQIKSDSPYLNATLQVRQIREKKIRAAPSSEIVAKLVLKILHTPSPHAFYPIGGKGAKIKGFLMKHMSQDFVAKITRNIYHLP